ncbi:MAG: single-stranded DNA-binding protein [Epulopiscium sp.]|nr:single-stranded DNA-binding protein [Candidatus Epulonipiscium sp.]
MKEQVMKNNQVTIIGKVVSEFTFSHEVYGEGFYSFYVEVQRLSEVVDQLPVTISERLLHGCTLEEGTLVEIQGQFRSYNRHDGEKNRLVLTVFARELFILTDDLIYKNPNQIVLAGFVCKKPVYRTTPFGREIADLLLAVNRPYSKSDYIPCIAWGRNARYAQNLEVGEMIRIWGRIQSREYQKKQEDGESVARMAYEVSVSKMELEEKLEESEGQNEELD